MLQCPPRGAKEDHLYVNISAAALFNLAYRISVADVLEREMLLTYHLHLTDSDGFINKRKGKHGDHSYLMAKTSIDNFYPQRLGSDLH